MKCDDGLRYRALAKAKGDYEAHEVAQCSNAYVLWCKDNNTVLATWAEVRLRMFVDTPLRWREACTAASAQNLQPRAKRYQRVKRKLKRNLTKKESKRIRQLG
jgi:hypothetical protein